MTARWESIAVDGNTMRIDMGVPEKPGADPGIIIAPHAGGVDENAGIFQALSEARSVSA